MNTGWTTAAIGALLFLVLGLLVKVTTAISFGILGARGMAARPRVASVRGQESIAILIAAIGFLDMSWWLSYTGAIKFQNPFRVNLTSAGLLRWNFGSLAQHMSSDRWLGVTVRRAVREAFGSAGILRLYWLELAGGCGRLVTGDFSTATSLHLADRIPLKTAPGRARLVAMHGWSPAITYYAGRQSLTPPAWSEEKSLRNLTASPTAS